MAPRSKIAKLPPETKAWLDRALSDSNFGDYELLAAELKARGFDISRSAVHRYGQEFEIRLSALRMATEQAKAIADSAPDDAGAMNDALIRLVQQKAFDALLKMEEGAPMKEIGLMVARLSNATVKQKQWAAAVREKTAAAATSVASKARKGGLSEDVIRQIEEEVLGIAR